MIYAIDMSRRFLLGFAALMSFSGLWALDFTGVAAAAVEIKPETSSGLEAVYVLPGDDAGARLVYTGSGADVRWYRFSALGGAYAEEITAERDGNRWSVPFAGEDMGYIVEEGTVRHCFWVVDYSKHCFAVASLAASRADDCGRTLLAVDGDAAPIPYYSINGRRLEISRELILSYSTLSFDEGAFAYSQIPVETVLAGISGTTAIQAPLCNTTFHLEGDRFLRAWGEGVSVESGFYTTTAVEAETKAESRRETADNEQSGGDESALGGSAPCTIGFEAAVTDAAIFTEWQISRSSDFDMIDNSYTELAFDYTFNESGTTYVRFVANNADGDCEFTGTTYEVFIGESKLEIPNAFSPEASPGVNDEWKVSYKSLVSFECHIFNRWGTCLFSTTEPSAGWDGKYRGKFVPAGVYYYVIKAVGADGVKYDRAGDINIINFTGSGAGSADTGTEE